MMHRMWKCAQRGQAIATARSLICPNTISASTHSTPAAAIRTVKSWAKSAEKNNSQATDASKTHIRAPATSSSSSVSSSSASSELPEYDDEFTSGSVKPRSIKPLEEYTEEELNDALLDTMDTDKIVLKNMKYFGHHGVYAHETATGQPFEVDLELETDLSLAGETDDLSHTVNYEQIHEIVSKIMTGQPHKLLERVSYLIIDALLTIFPTVQSVNVTIRKPKVGLKGTLDHAAINLKRSRATYVPLAQRHLIQEERGNAQRKSSPRSSAAPVSSTSPSTPSASSSSSSSSTPLRTTASLKRSLIPPRRAEAREARASSGASAPVNKLASAAANASRTQQQPRNVAQEEQEPEEEEGTPAQWEAQQAMFEEMDARLAEAEKRALAKKAARAAGGASAASASAPAATPATPSRSNAMPPLKSFNAIRK